jgi:hypothetical protein
MGRGLLMTKVKRKKYFDDEMSKKLFRRGTYTKKTLRQ